MSWVGTRGSSRQAGCSQTSAACLLAPWVLPPPPAAALPATHPAAPPDAYVVGQRQVGIEEGLDGTNVLPAGGRGAGGGQAVSMQGSAAQR